MFVTTTIFLFCVLLVGSSQSTPETKFSQRTLLNTKQYEPTFSTSTFAEGCYFPDITFDPCNQLGFSTPDREGFDPPQDMFILRIYDNTYTVNQDAYNTMWSNAKSFISDVLNNVSGPIHAPGDINLYYYYDCPNGDSYNIRMYFGTANSTYTDEFVQAYYEFAAQYCDVILEPDYTLSGVPFIVGFVLFAACLAICGFLACKMKSSSTSTGQSSGANVIAVLFVGSSN